MVYDCVRTPRTLRSMAEKNYLPQKENNKTIYNAIRIDVLNTKLAS